MFKLKYQIVQLFEKAIFGKLMFGWANCPNCGCLSPLTIRLNRFSRARCMCCNRSFAITHNNFHEEKLTVTERV
jgi:hypothetical protein